MKLTWSLITSCTPTKQTWCAFFRVRLVDMYPFFYIDELVTLHRLYIYWMMIMGDDERWRKMMNICDDNMWNSEKTQDTRWKKEREDVWVCKYGQYVEFFTQSKKKIFHMKAISQWNRVILKFGNCFSEEGEE